MIPHHTGTESWKHHRTDLSGSTARMLLARSAGVFPAMRFRAPVNVPVALIFLAKFMGTRGSQSPLVTPVVSSVVVYRYTDISGYHACHAETERGNSVDTLVVVETVPGSGDTVVVQCRELRGDHMPAR